MKKEVMLLIATIILATMVASAVGQPMDRYQAAIDRLIVPYSHGTVKITVTVGANEPAMYSLEMWTKGKEVTSSVIIDANAPFMIGLAFLEEGDQVTAWWPSIGVEKTFNSSQSEEEVGFGMGRIDRVIWHGEDYEATFVKETNIRWEYRVTPKDPAAADFAHAIIYVDKVAGTLVGADFFDANSEVIESNIVSDYQEIETGSGDNFLYPISFVCDDIANNKTTTMEYMKIEFPDSIDDSVFTLDFLKAKSTAILNQAD